MRQVRRLSAAGMDEMTDLLAALDSKELNEPLVETLMMLEILRAENGDLQARAETAEAQYESAAARIVVLEEVIDEKQREINRLKKQRTPIEVRIAAENKRIEEQKEMMTAMKKALKEKGITYDDLARWCDKSNSAIANQLQGNYPSYQSWQLTKYLADAIERMSIDVPKALRTF